MSYTDADVERVAEAICNADTTSWKNTDDTQTLPDVTWAEMRDDTDYIPYEGISLGRDHYRGMARAALEAMAREPIEDVLRAQHVYNIQIEPAGPNYYAEVVSAAHDRRTGTGATIDDAIRAAVAAANEGR